MQTLKNGIFNYNFENRFRVAFFHTREDVAALGASCSAITIPTIIMGHTPQPTNVRQIHIPGDSMEFEDVNAQFLLQENMANWRAIVDWIFRLRNPDQACLTREVIDIGIDVLDAKHETVLECTLKDAFPFTISDVPLNHQIDDAEPNRFDVSFKLNGFKYQPIGE